MKDVRDELKEGQQILVKVINIDPTGKIRLSRKALLQDEAPEGGSSRPGRQGIAGLWRQAIYAAQSCAGNRAVGPVV